MPISWKKIKEHIHLIRNFYLRKINKKKYPPKKVVKKLAGVYAFLTIILLIVFGGIFLNIGDKYEIPVLTHIGSFFDIKYLAGADKFKVSMKPNFKTYIGESIKIPFVINSYKQCNADITVYLKSYESDDYIPSYKYINSVLLEKGESEDNQFEIDAIPEGKGEFEICFIIDDRSFFSINKYKDCPSILRVIDSQSGDENK